MTTRKRLAAVAVAGTVLVAGATALVTTTVTTTKKASQGFFTHCAVSHFKQVDPIVAPGVNVMSSHMHEFFGNTTTDSDSTYELMTAGTTTCDATADTAGYWVPTLLDPKGNVISTGVVKVYYRPGGDEPVTAFPPDYRIIADRALWYCGAGGEGTMLPRPCGSKPVRVRVFFPNCWDGVNTDSPTHRTQATFAKDTDCAGVNVPSLLLNVVYNGVHDPTGYSLSSGDFSTMHADFWNTWQQDQLVDLVDECMNTPDTKCGRISGAA